MNRLSLFLFWARRWAAKRVKRLEPPEGHRLEKLFERWLRPAWGFVRAWALFFLGLVAGWTVLVLFAHELGVADVVQGLDAFFVGLGLER